MPRYLAEIIRRDDKTAADTPLARIILTVDARSEDEAEAIADAVILMLKNTGNMDTDSVYEAAL